METQILEPTQTNIMKCAREVKNGNVIAFPTETVYGLAASAFDEGAVKKIFEIKGREFSNPLAVQVYRHSQIESVVKEITPVAKILMSKFMPGPITLVFDKKDTVSDLITAGNKTVAVRMPSHKVALDLIRYCNTPIVAPSANTSSKPSPTLAAHVLNDLNGKIPYILDGGQSPIGIESTIVDVRGDCPKLLRMGSILAEDIQNAVGKVQIVSDDKKNSAAKYSPRAQVYFSAFYEDMHNCINAKYDSLEKNGHKSVILCLDSRVNLYNKRKTIKMGKNNDDYARNLFAAFRRADEQDFDCIIAEGITPDGIGQTLINRLIKSSKGQII